MRHPSQLGNRQAVQEMLQRQRALLRGKGTGFVHQRQDHRIAQQAADSPQASRDSARRNVQNLSDLPVAQLIFERQLYEQFLLRLKMAGATQKAVSMRGRRARRLRSEVLVDTSMIDKRHVSLRDWQDDWNCGRPSHWPRRGGFIPLKP